jgi:hypothetical protein
MIYNHQSSINLVRFVGFEGIGVRGICWRGRNRLGIGALVVKSF